MKRDNLTPPMSPTLRECWMMLGTAITIGGLLIGFQIFTILTQ